MHRISFAALLLTVGVVPLHAATATETAVSVFEAVGKDSERLKTFCIMNRVMNAAADEQDNAKLDAADKEIETYLTTLGPDFKTAWTLGAESDPESPEGKALNTAIEALEEKCDK